jgi:hypothetical protein
MDIFDVAVPVVLAVLAVAAICRKSKGEKPGGAAPPPDTAKYRVATPEAAEAFFRDARNCRLPVEEILGVLGRPADYDDWDLGRLVYTWRNADRCLRIYTQGASLQSVVLMDPVDTPRFGAPLEVIWER